MWRMNVWSNLMELAAGTVALFFGVHACRGIVGFNGPQIQQFSCGLNGAYKENCHQPLLDVDNIA